MVIEAGSIDGAGALDAHTMDPQAVLAMVAEMGGGVGRPLVVGCQPGDLTEGIGLTAPVAAVGADRDRRGPRPDRRTPLERRPVHTRPDLARPVHRRPSVGRRERLVRRFIRFVVIILALGVAGLAARAVAPDIARYLKLRRM